MAELLIKATDATHADPDIDRAGCYKRGMVVRVENDGFEWGKKEGPPTFAVVRIPGTPASDYEKLIDARCSYTEEITYDDFAPKCKFCRQGE